MMDFDLFKTMIKMQNQWRDEYHADKRTRHIIRTIANRKYLSKGRKGVDEIRKSLEEGGYLEELILTQNQSGELCFDYLYGK
jgi:hypothetical protein